MWGFSDYQRENLLLTDFETSFLDHKMANNGTKKLPASDISKDIILIIYMVIYFSNSEVGGNGLIYKNK